MRIPLTIDVTTFMVSPIRTRSRRGFESFRAGRDEIMSWEGTTGSRLRPLAPPGGSVPSSRTLGWRAVHAKLHVLKTRSYLVEGSGRTPAESAPIVIPRPERPLFRPRTILIALIVAGGVTTAFAALPLVVSVSWAPLDHFECRPGTVVAQDKLLTPLLMLNAPYGGNASGTVHESATSSWSTTVHNGSAAALFVLRNWSVARSLRVLAAGPGTNAACPEFLATPGFYNEYLSIDLLPANSTSDAAEPTALEYSGYGSVLFHNGFANGDGITMATCTWNGLGHGYLRTTSSHITVEVPFSWNGTTATAKSTLEYVANYSYEFPGGAGTWSIDDLNLGTNAPGGGYAFTFTPCP